MTIDPEIEANIRALSWRDAGRDRKREFHRRESVYVIAAGDYQEDGTAVKIGWTALPPRQRLSALQQANATELHLVCAFPGSRALEENLHLLLDEYRIRGEWFRSSVELRDLVAIAGNEISSFRKAA